MLLYNAFAFLKYKLLIGFHRAEALLYSRRPVDHDGIDPGGGP